MKKKEILFIKIADKLFVQRFVFGRFVSFRGTADIEIAHVNGFVKPQYGIGQPLEQDFFLCRRIMRLCRF